MWAKERLSIHIQGFQSIGVASEWRLYGNGATCILYQVAVSNQ